MTFSGAHHPDRLQLLQKISLVLKGPSPPCPPASHKWPIRALGSPQPNSRASPRAPRAALPHGNGRPWPTSLRGWRKALGSPLPAQSRALAHHLARHACTPCTPTRQPARSARDEPPSPLLSRPATSTGPVVTSLRAELSTLYPVECGRVR